MYFDTIILINNENISILLGDANPIHNKNTISFIKDNVIFIVYLFFTVL